MANAGAMTDLDAIADWIAAPTSKPLVQIAHWNIPDALAGTMFALPHDGHETGTPAGLKVTFEPPHQWDAR